MQSRYLIDSRQMHRRVSFFVFFVDETLKLWRLPKKSNCCPPSTFYSNMKSISTLVSLTAMWRTDNPSLFLTHAAKLPFFKSSLTNSLLPKCAAMCRGVHPETSPCSIVDGHFVITSFTKSKKIVATPEILSKLFLFHFEKISSHFGMF